MAPRHPRSSRDPLALSIWNGPYVSIDTWSFVHVWVPTCSFPRPLVGPVLTLQALLLNPTPGVRCSGRVLSRAARTHDVLRDNLGGLPELDYLQK